MWRAVLLSKVCELMSQSQKRRSFTTSEKEKNFLDGWMHPKGVKLYDPILMILEALYCYTGHFVIMIVSGV